MIKLLLVANGREKKYVSRWSFRSAKMCVWYLAGPILPPREKVPL